MVTVMRSAKLTKTLRLGPLDYGRPISFDDFMAADYQGGWRYELINGRLSVAPWPNFAEDWVHAWLRTRVTLYALANPRVINHVTGPGRVFIPGRSQQEVSAPEPDLLAYKRFPRSRRKRDLRWQDVSPVLVGEVLSADDPHKDLVRNVALYLQVSSIKEYWILDAREDADYPSMLAYRRRGRQWQDAIEIGPNETYTTPLLPGFRLTLDTSS
jgi:Uma2 family endonuclease